MEKAAALGQRAAQASGAERDTLQAQAQALRARFATANKFVAGLVAVAIATMALARYL
jgi:hypothetical protein